MKNIKVVLLAGYVDLFGRSYEGALKSIEQYPLQVVLFELVGINFRMRGSTMLHIDVSPKTQMELIFHWLGKDPYVLDLFSRLNSVCL